MNKNDEFFFTIFSKENNKGKIKVRHKTSVFKYRYGTCITNVFGNLNK